METTVCDLCGTQLDRTSYINKPGDWTDIHLGMKIVGSPDYQDICPNCTIWLIETLDGKRKQ